uniref:Uncharacterized protein n=1 Tax=Anguilla anguilla TaxID=7936 RepID=A0A0E9WPH3_ANGAN
MECNLNAKNVISITLQMKITSQIHYFLFYFLHFSVREKFLSST